MSDKRWYSDQHAGHQEFERKYRAQHETFAAELRAGLKLLTRLAWWRRAR